MDIRQAFGTALAILASVSGGGAIVAWFSDRVANVWAERFLERERAKHAAELEALKDRMENATRQFQGEIDKTIFVHRIHFEAEFRALSDVWKRVTNLQRYMALVSGQPIALQRKEEPRYRRGSSPLVMR